MSLMFRFAAIAIAMTVMAGCTESTQADQGRKLAGEENCSESVGPNELTKAEKKQGWVLLFDGKTTKGWVGIGKDSFPKTGWKIEDGILTVNPDIEKGAKRGGDIITLKTYDDFDFKIDFNITEGANSGVKYFVRQEDAKKGKGLGLEFQILDDAKHRDAKKGIDGNRTVGSLYDLITADESKKVNPHGQWNTARIISKGKKVEHWLNGKKMLEYDRSTKEFADLVAGSKYKKIKGFGLAEKGYILLQDHRNTLSFRNVKIRELK